MLDLLTFFNSILLPGDINDHSQSLVAKPIPGYENHRLAKDINGTPSLLISTNKFIESKKPIPIKLEYITVQYNVNCQIYHTNGKIKEEQFTIITCTGLDHELHIYFLRIIETLITSLGTAPSLKDVSYAITNLVTLFRAMSNKPRKSVQGLWAELYLIAQANDPDTLLHSWHLTPEDRYDFSIGNQRIEVKSTSTRIRQHYFSLEQLCPPTNTDLLIASLFVEYAGAGTSIIELVKQISSRLNSKPNILFHMDNIISLTLGENWREAVDTRFDIELAEASLKFFDAATVPSIDKNLPIGVSEVKFKADLTSCVPVSLDYIAKLDSLFKAVLPKNKNKLKN